MKLIIKVIPLLFLLVFVSCEKSKGLYVYDGNKLFTEKEISKLNEHIAQIDKNTTVQILVYITSSLSGKTVQEYGLEIGNKFGVGKKGINNGVVILLAPNDRKINISIGHGLEWILSDAKCDTIRNYITQSFSKGDFFIGVEKGLSMLENYVSKYNWEVKSIQIDDIPEKDTGKILKFKYTNKESKKYKYALNCDQQLSPDFKISLKAENHNFDLFYTKYMNSFLSKILTEKNIIIYARLIDWKSKRLELLGIEE